MDTTKVLIIDDEIDFADPLAQRLCKRGFDGKAAGSTDEAMAIMERGWIADVIVLDLQMPGCDGLTTLDLLKNRFPTIEIIMLTGHPSTISSVAGMKRGLFEYLMKPVTIDILVEKIQAARQRQTDVR